MREQLKQTIETLKKRVMYNLQVIRKNEQKIREILKEPVSSDRSERLEERYSINKEMLKENNESINIQLSIVQFLDRYHQKIDKFKLEAEPETENNQKDKNPEPKDFNIVKKKEITKDDYFELTIHNGIDYDANHPYYDDDEFYNMLMEHYTDLEDYEMCSKLLVQHKKNDAFSSN